MVHVTKNVHCVAYFGKTKPICKKGTRSLQLVFLFTAGEHQLKDDWGFLWFVSIPHAYPCKRSKPEFSSHGYSLEFPDMGC